MLKEDIGFVFVVVFAYQAFDGERMLLVGLYWSQINQHFCDIDENRTSNELEIL